MSQLSNAGCEAQWWVLYHNFHSAAVCREFFCTLFYIRLLCFLLFTMLFLQCYPTYLLLLDNNLSVLYIAEVLIFRQLLCILFGSIPTFIFLHWRHNPILPVSCLVTVTIQLYLHLTCCHNNLCNSLKFIYKIHIYTYIYIPKYTFYMKLSGLLNNASCEHIYWVWILFADNIFWWGSRKQNGPRGGNLCP